MDGVILFADDQVFNTRSNEYKLFCKFNSNSELTVLPIDNLYSLEKVLSSVSTYKALILDWNFKRQKDDSNDDDTQLPDETPFELIKNNEIYSLIYIYSQNPIGDDTQKKLREAYHEKIFFATKSNSNDIDTEYRKILQGIQDFENSNKHMEIPFLWSQTINKSAQKIFVELENADKFWIKELFYSSVRKPNKDGTFTDVEIEPTIEVVNLFQNLLFEKLIQDISLKEAIQKYSTENYMATSDLNSTNTLFSRLYYTKTLETDTIMTGDIYIYFLTQNME